MRPAGRLGVAISLLAATVMAHGEGCIGILDGAGQVHRAECPAAGAGWITLLVPRINGRIAGNCAYVIRHGGRLYVSINDLDAWHVRVPETPSLRYRDRNYYPLDAVPGLTYRVDDCTQELLISGDQDIFRSTSIHELGTRFMPPTASNLGGFLNYDAQWSGTPHDDQLAGLLELGAFGRGGVLTSTFLSRNPGTGQEVIRLDTTYTRDRPERRETLRLGDAATRAGAWGRSVRFGGAQWGTNFATQPGTISYPLPAARGEAVMPSTVDVYANNVLRRRLDVPPGPFELSNVPVITGTGDVTLIVRDLLGREITLTQPYYVSTALLRDGLRDFSLEAGMVREDYGLRSREYGHAFASGTYRAGLSDAFTGELRGEAIQKQQTAGATGVFLLPGWGTIETGVAASHSDTSRGALLVLGTERQASGASLGVRGHFATPEFTQMGLPEGQQSPRHTITARLGLPTRARSSFAFGLLRQDFRNQPDIDTVSAAYNTDWRETHLSLFAVRTRSDGTTNTVGLVFTRAFGTRTSGSLQFNRQGTQTRTTLQASRNLPEGEGFGYRLLAENGTPDRSEAGVSWQTNVGTYSLESSRVHDTTSHRVNASGGVAFMGGQAFPARHLTDSFAVVRAGDFAGVRIYAENQPVGRTNRNGYALVPRLRAYEDNRVGIEQADLPIDAEVGRLSATVTPYYRSGVMVEIPVKRSGGATLTILLEDSMPLPPGAVAVVFGRENEEFPVGLDGRVYLTGLTPRNWIHAIWRGQRCEIRLDVPSEAGPLPDLGTFVCKGVKR